MMRNLLPRSLFGRALLILLLPMVLAQMVATYVFFDRHWDKMMNRLAYGVAGDISLAVGLSDDAAYSEGQLMQLLGGIERQTDLGLSLRDAESFTPAEVADTTRQLNRVLYRNLSLKIDPDRFIIIDRAAEKLREVRVKTARGMLHVTIPERRLQSATAHLFLLWMVGSALFFFAIAVLFMRNQIRPIRRLAQAADNFGKGHDVESFKPEGALEVRQAAQAFLVMRDRIRRQIQQRTEMLAGVSHDLRTPLTRMKLQLAMMPKQNGMDELQQDISEMEHMVEGYLAFAKGEGGEASAELDMRDFISDMIADSKRAGAKRNIVFNRGELPALPMRVRVQAMKRCLGNLISNALRYAQTVQISVEVQEKAIFIHVDDDGPGIPEHQREDVLRPFVRLDESRNPETGGVGLGLSIARDVARGHGGDLSLSASPLGGLRATIRLPH